MNRAMVCCGVALAALALGASGCAEPEGGSAAVAADGPPSFDTTLGLQLVAHSADSAVIDLWYAPDEGQPGPRAMELWLRLPDTATLAAAEIGEAATAAGKTLVAQPQGDHDLRLVIYGTASLDRVAGGRLATLRLTLATPGPATVELLERLPIFAPAEANTGLRLPPPLVIGGE